MPAVLTNAQLHLLDSARTATLATTAADGRARLVPVCFALGSLVDGDPVVWTPLDQKPKSGPDPNALARVRDIVARPGVTVLVQRWDEDWTRLAWLRAYGSATILEPQPHEMVEHAAAVALLRAKYPQYREHALEVRPLIRIRIERVVAWSAGDSA